MLSRSSSSSLSLSAPRATGERIFLSVLPTGVKFVVKFVFCVFVLQQLNPSLTTWYAFSPAAVLKEGKIWLLWTGPLLHGDLQHVCLNMLAVCAFHTPLERKFGTLRYLELVLWSMLLSKLSFLSLALLQVWIYDRPDILHQRVVGFSGVIFLLSVLECHLFPQFVREIHVPIFGNIHIKSQWYPWALLLWCEFIIPGSSFTGHLAGILAGVAVQTGWIRPWYVPAEILQEMEGYKALRFLTSDRYFTETPCFGSEPSFDNGTSPRNHRASHPRHRRKDDSEEQEVGPSTEPSFEDRNTDDITTTSAAAAPESDAPSEEEMRDLRCRRYKKSEMVRKPTKKPGAPRLRQQYLASGGRTLRNPVEKDESANNNEANETGSKKEDKKEEPAKQLSPEELRALRRKRYQVKPKKVTAAVPKTRNPSNDFSRHDYQSASYRARLSAQRAEANATSPATGFNPYQATTNGYFAAGYD